MWKIIEIIYETIISIETYIFPSLKLKSEKDMMSVESYIADFCDSDCGV